MTDTREKAKAGRTHTMSFMTRNKNLVVRVTAEEKEAVERVSQRLGLSVSGWVRMVLRKRIQVEGLLKEKED